MSKNKIFKKHVCSSGTWACSLQRFQHPLPLLERQSPQKWEGETGVPEAVLWGRLVGNRQWQRSCRRHFYFQPLQEGPEHPSENQLQFEGPQQWGKQNVCYTPKENDSFFFFSISAWNLTKWYERGSRLIRMWFGSIGIFLVNSSI